MYSNCLFEAIKAKIKDPKNVQIIFISPKINGGEFHTFWADKDSVYHAYDKGTSKGFKKYFFKPSFKKVSIQTFEGWILDILIRRLGYEGVMKYAKKLHLTTFGVKGFTDWAPYLKNASISRLPSKDEIKELVHGSLYVKVSIKDENGFDTIKYLPIDEVKKLSNQYDFFLWKYVTPYDPDYIHIGKPFNNKTEFLQ